MAEPSVPGDADRRIGIGAI